MNDDFEFKWTNILVMVVGCSMTKTENWSKRVMTDCFNTDMILLPENSQKYVEFTFMQLHLKIQKDFWCVLA